MGQKQSTFTETTGRLSEVREARKSGNVTLKGP